MGGVESDYSVCPRPLLQLLQFLQFRSVTLRQFTLDGWDMELDKNKTGTRHGAYREGEGGGCCGGKGMVRDR